MYLQCLWLGRIKHADIYSLLEVHLKDGKMFRHTCEDSLPFLRTEEMKKNSVRESIFKQ